MIDFFCGSVSLLFVRRGRSAEGSGALAGGPSLGFLLLDGWVGAVAPRAVSSALAHFRGYDLFLRDGTGGCNVHDRPGHHADHYHKRPARHHADAK